ncbi:MAG TPA: hypothetical protein VGL13_17285, partial [Polyangiaceae bacterium]
MRREAWIIGGASVAVLACRGPLPNHDTGGARAADGDAAFPIGPRLSFDPPPSVDGASAYSRLTVELDAVADDVRVLLVRDQLSTAQLRDLARPVLPTSLESRAVDVVAWVDASAIHVAPAAPLAPGATYTIGVSSPPAGLSFQVAPSSADRVLARVWPPPSAATSIAGAVWCGAFDLPAVAVPARLEPAGIDGGVEPGTGSSISIARCVHWSALGVGEAVTLPAVTPPSIAFDDGTRVVLEPIVMLPGAIAAPVVAATCGPSEITFGRGCAEIQDDRAIVRSADAALLWTIDDGVAPVVRAAAASARFMLRPLPLQYRVAT